MTTGTETRQRILLSAWELIYVRSFGDVGVQAICDHSGVNKGSFYHFFPSKQDLVLAMLKSFAVDYQNDLLNQALEPNLPPLERLERLVQMSYQFQRELTSATDRTLGCLFGNLAAEMSSIDEPLRLAIAEVFETLKDRLTETLDQAVADGAMAAVDTKTTAEAMLAYLEGVLLLAKTQNDPEVILRLGPALSEIRIPGTNP